MNKNRNFKGVWLPKELYLNHELSWSDKILLIEIDSLDNDLKKGCFASNKYFGEFLNKSHGTIANIISRLIRLGYIKRIFFDGHNRGLRINKGKTGYNFYKEPSRKNEGNLHKKMNEPSRKDEHINTISNTDTINAHFKTFWNLYDKKVDRERAWKKFIKLSQKDIQTIIERTPSFVKANPDKQYRPNPSTYINNRRFEDEITTIKTATTKSKYKKL
ncbi:helix-turn-helix domain-containing protein [Saprospiraceae bacterium]|nr:helix-turn-helix domain-containing protein [Saprospiraceae bacterium]